MRLLSLVLLLTALPAAAAPRSDTPRAGAAPAMQPMARPESDTCKRPDLHQAETPGPPVSRKLGELPDGDLLLSVYNQVDGCMEPVIVRYGEGREPVAQAPQPVRPRARVWR